MAHDRAIGEGRLGRALVDRLDVHVFEIPTEHGPESDGTLVWASTTMVLVEARGAGLTGLGYTYATAATAAVIQDLLAPVVVGIDALSIPAASARMIAAVRNQGVPGISACAISAVDVALWDLKARLLGVALADLLGPARTRVPLYASGGFTSSSPSVLAAEIASYVAAGFRRVKIKIGREPAKDLERIRTAREAAGHGVELMIDANGAYQRKPALALAEAAAEHGVVWFEEPVPSTDLDGLRLLCDHAPAGMNIAAGEYGYELSYFRHMLDAGAVDVLQADATRCLGVTGFLRVDALCAAHGIPLSSHCAPALHAHLDAAAGQIVHLEYFRDHARIEAMLFDGNLEPEQGALAYDRRRAGLGIRLRKRESERHAV